jgi:hypothetical protein
MSFTEVISTKPQSSYPEDILQEFALVSIDKKNSFPIGSYSYRIQKYPSDIDMLEEVVGCCSVSEVVNEFTKNLQKIVEILLSKQNHYFMEIKAGLDERFLIDMDNLENVINKVNELRKQELISNEEYQVIIDSQNLNEIDKILRDHYVIRWTADEVLKGEKLLPGGGMITLQQAMRQKSKINIEIIAYVNGRFIDVSNFFILVLNNPGGPEQVINLPQDIYDNFDDYFVGTLKDAIVDLLDEGEYFKAIKRMWSLARFEHDEGTIFNLKPIISGDVSALNQVKADLAAIIKLYKKSFNPPHELVIKELSEMKDRISNNLLIDRKDLDNHNQQLDKAIELMQANDLTSALTILEYLMKHFKEKVNSEAKKFLF